MFVGYVDNHANNVYRFINLKTKKIVMSRNITWLGKLYCDLYDSNNVQNEYNMDKEQATDTCVEIDIEKEKVKKIPCEVKNLQTSYNDAETVIIKDSLDDHEQREFGGFALAIEEAEYPPEPITFQEAWDHPIPIEQTG